MEVLCKYSEITVPANETAEWWCHVTGANVRGISPELWAHKPRPRSSSARSQARTPNLRPRQPSVSPPRRQSDCTNFLSHAQHNAEISEEELWAACAGKADPYFSCHPPSAPMELVIIGAPLTLPIVHTLARHDLKGVWPRFEQDSKEQVWLTPQLLHGTPPHARAPMSSRARVKAEFERAARGPRRAVRRILREFIATLPLLSPREEQQNDTEASAKVAASVDASVSAVTVPPAPAPPPPPPPLVTRSVAVQAHSLKALHVDKGIMGSHYQLQTKIAPDDNGAGEKRSRTADAWVGGARALRDSHVRLVLRQLRHIERLNRALDHAVPSASIKHKQ